jgi:hypothetical protein
LQKGKSSNKNIFPLLEKIISKTLDKEERRRYNEFNNIPEMKG